MNRRALQSLSLLSAGLLSTGAAVAAPTCSAVKAIFENPPREYSSAPLWVWNDRLTDEEITSTLRDLASQNVKQAIVHPRPGLMTPYLSDEWFRLWKLALQEAEKLDMNLWIYDENSYPSGFAGGFVPDAMPESRGCSLLPVEAKSAPKWSKDTIAVFRMSADGFEDVSEAVRGGKTLPDSTYLVFNLTWAEPTPWLGGKWYVDLLRPGVTEKFLEITMDAYARQIGEHFGKRVPGVFTDEPHLRAAAGLPWTAGLPQVFEKRWGYKLTDNLPSLTRRVGDFRKVRHDYFRLLLEQFIEHWGKPYHDWCEKHKLEFTGHYWEHEWPGCISVPDNMAMYAWHQRPAIDILLNRYSESTNSQFGNVRAVKELASVANQLGRKRTLCEAYGAGGWDLRFEDMKRIGDWCYVLGVNTLDEHLSFITLRGARKHDHPQSFSYHEPWWDAYKANATYFTRLSAALSQGEQVNTVLLIEPTTTAWMYNAHGGDPQLERIGKTFFDTVMDLERQQVEYDIGCEDIISRNGSVNDKAFVVGQRRYDIVVLPPDTETLNAPTVELLDLFLQAGGKVLCCGEAPAFVDGRPSDRLTRLASGGGWAKLEASDLCKQLQTLAAQDLVIRRPPADKGILFHHRRRLADGDLLFLVNTSKDHSSSATFRARCEGLEQWDLDTGKILPYKFLRLKDGVGSVFELPPSGSMLLFLARKGKIDPSPMLPPQRKEMASDRAPEIRRTAPNVLTLDYVDLTVAGETHKNVGVLKAANLVFQKHGLKKNPWDRAVQFKDELIARKFPSDSGFEATYRFTVKDKAPDRLWIVVEYPELYDITCNGRKVSAAKGEWWLDKGFHRIDISSTAKTGENAVTLKASPLKIEHELDCAYVLGDFSLEPVERGFVIAPAAPLSLGKWNEQGHPFYATGVTYTEIFDVAEPTGRYHLRLPAWYGSVARVAVNGKPAGLITAPPWECDVTEVLLPGSNTVEVTVIGTLKNTLGPHHGNPPPGIAGPSSWDAMPESGPPAGKSYSTIGYGLFEPFVLVQIVEKQIAKPTTREAKP